MLFSSLMHKHLSSTSMKQQRWHLQHSPTPFTKRTHPSRHCFQLEGGGSGSDILNNMALASDSRSRFISSAIKVARDNNFDGVDLDWEYPTTQIDMDNLGLLLAEWREAVNQDAVTTGKPTLLLSAATYYKPEFQWGIARTFPVASMNQNLDWINAMCYDYHGSWDNNPSVTGTLAALYDPNGTVSTSDGLQSWIAAGMQREKLVMGLPLYGRSWILENPDVNGIGAPAVYRPGFDDAMSYAQVEASNADNNATVVFDEATVSVYSFAGTTWISYDDESSIQRKVEYARDQNIGGYFFWQILGDLNQRFSGVAALTWPN
ncbi:hypothetical protein R6Q59_033666 [Mikania micrantha]